MIRIGRRTALGLCSRVDAAPDRMRDVLSAQRRGGDGADHQAGRYEHEHAQVVGQFSDPRTWPLAATHFIPETQRKLRADFQMHVRLYFVRAGDSPAALRHNDG